MKTIPIKLVFMSALILLFLSCDRGKVNIFSVQDDIDLGQEVTEQILGNPEEFPILDENEYPEAYQHLRRIRDNVLKSDEIKYKDRFDWDVFIVNKDVLNAFALPGGNTFYYTGLIKYLEDEASFAGVVAHEIAHSDLRHSTNRMTKIYGYQTLISLALGTNPGLGAQIAADLALGLGALKFSRQDEYEADEHAVKYLYPSELDARGVAYFFELMELEEGSDIMVYFSTHPHPSDRIEKIYEHHEAFGGKEGNRHAERYQEFKNSLP